ADRLAGVRRNLALRIEGQWRQVATVDVQHVEPDVAETHGNAGMVVHAQLHEAACAVDMDLLDRHGRWIDAFLGAAGRTGREYDSGRDRDHEAIGHGRLHTLANSLAGLVLKAGRGAANPGGWDRTAPPPSRDPGAAPAGWSASASAGSCVPASGRPPRAVPHSSVGAASARSYRGDRAEGAAMPATAGASRRYPAAAAPAAGRRRRHAVAAAPASRRRTADARRAGGSGSGRSA